MSSGIKSFFIFRSHSFWELINLFMINLSVNKIHHMDSSLIVSIPNTKNKLQRKFVASEEHTNVNYFSLYYEHLPTEKFRILHP